MKSLYNTNNTIIDNDKIDGRIEQCYYGMKTCLNVFLYGLFGQNTLDEGLTVYN